MTARRLALRILLGSLAITAILSIAAILAGDLGETTARILGTTTTISLSSLFALASLSGWDARGAEAFSRVGLAASLGLTVLLVNAIWADPVGGTYWQVTLSLLLIAFVCGQGSLLAIAKLAPAYRWLRTAANASSILLGAALLAVLWEAADGEGIGRAIAVLSVLEVALTLATVVCHVLGPDGDLPDAMPPP